MMGEEGRMMKAKAEMRRLKAEARGKKQVLSTSQPTLCEHG
jgi:hypothetical protein